MEDLNTIQNELDALHKQKNIAYKRLGDLRKAKDYAKDGDVVDMVKALQDRIDGLQREIDIWQDKKLRLTDKICGEGVSDGATD